jgi:hypothetical protein
MLFNLTYLRFFLLQLLSDLTVNLLIQYSFGIVLFLKFDGFDIDDTFLPSAHHLFILLFDLLFFTLILVGVDVILVISQ